MGRNVEYTINNQRDSKLHMFHDVHKWVFSSLLNLLKNSSNTTLLRSSPFPVIGVGKVTICGRRHWRSFPPPISEGSFFIRAQLCSFVQFFSCADLLICYNSTFQVWLAEEFQMWARSQEMLWYRCALCSWSSPTSSPTHDISCFSCQIRVSSSNIALISSSLILTPCFPTVLISKSY